MVVVVSGEANQSEHVPHEFEVACNHVALDHGVVVVPFRVDSIESTEEMVHYFAVEHRVDAVTPFLESHIARLGEVVLGILRSLRQRPENRHLRMSRPLMLSPGHPEMVSVRRDWRARLVALGTGAEVQHEILTSYSRALGREAHVVARSPELTWQQLHSRFHGTRSNTLQSWMTPISRGPAAVSADAIKARAGVSPEAEVPSPMFRPINIPRSLFISSPPRQPSAC